MAYMKKYSAKARSAAARYRAYLRKKLAARRKLAPVRFYAGSKKTYTKTRALSRAMKNYGETIYKGMIAQNEVQPSNQVGTTKTYTLGYTLGATVPSGWTNFIGLGSMAVNQGSGINERSGQWAYLKKSHATVSIDMKPNSGEQPAPGDPVQFRVIVFKARPAARNFGTSYAPNTSLFVNEDGQEFGHDSPSVNGSDLQLQPLNRRRWYIKSDQKFIMSPPANDSFNSFGSSFYPARKVCMIDMPFYKKIRFGGDSEPESVDTKWGILIIATSIAKYTSATNWELNLRGTTTYTDS